ncbi:replication initiator [Kribbella sp. CWNU-51]
MNSSAGPFVSSASRNTNRGINDGDKDVGRSIRYVTKYITKDVAESVRARSDPQRAHFDRLHEELSTLPCSPTCANWLLYGIQPKNAKPGLVPGRCKGRVHQPATLGFTGRRILVSRNWSAKTLADIRADNADWVRTVLAQHGDPGDQGDDEQAAAPEPPSAGSPDRFYYELARPDDPDVAPYQHRILTAIAARDRWRRHLRQALDEQQLSATTTEMRAA